MEVGNESKECHFFYDGLHSKNQLAAFFFCGSYTFYAVKGNEILTTQGWYYFLESGSFSKPQFFRHALAVPLRVVLFRL